MRAWLSRIYGLAQSPPEVRSLNLRGKLPPAMSPGTILPFEFESDGHREQVRPFTQVLSTQLPFMVRIGVLMEGLRYLPHVDCSARAGSGSVRIEESITCRLVSGLHRCEDPMPDEIFGLRTSGEATPARRSRGSRKSPGDVESRRRPGELIHSAPDLEEYRRAA
jgi:hypothetical protein